MPVHSAEGFLVTNFIRVYAQSQTLYIINVFKIRMGQCLRI